MTTITKERLLTIKQWRETYGPGSNVVLPAEEAEELARIALASLASLEAAEKRNAKLQSENAYIRNRFKELDLLIGKNILVMQAAIIEWQATGDAKSGLAWIYNTLFCPGRIAGRI